MGRFAEGPPELAAEVRSRKPGGVSQVIDGERLRVAGVDEVSGAKKVTLRRDDEHPSSIADGNGSAPLGGALR